MGVEDIRREEDGMKKEEEKSVFQRWIGRRLPKIRNADVT